MGPSLIKMFTVLMPYVLTSSGCHLFQDIQTTESLEMLELFVGVSDVAFPTFNTTVFITGTLLVSPV